MCALPICRSGWPWLRQAGRQARRRAATARATATGGFRPHARGGGTGGSVRRPSGRPSAAARSPVPCRPVLGVVVRDREDEPAAFRQALLSAVFARGRRLAEPRRRVERANRLRQAVRVARDERKRHENRFRRSAALQSGRSRRSCHLLEPDRPNAQVGRQGLFETGEKPRPREGAPQCDLVRVLDVRGERGDVETRQRRRGFLPGVLEARNLRSEARDRRARPARVGEIADHGARGDERQGGHEHREKGRRQVRRTRVDEGPAREIEAPRHQSPPASTPRAARVAGSCAAAAGVTVAPGARRDIVRSSGSEAPAAARKPRSASRTPDSCGPAAQLPATNAGGASAGRSGVPNATARRTSWTASPASAYGLVRAKRSCEPANTRVVAVSPSVQTRNQSPLARASSEETANAEVSSAPMRMPAFSNGASHEDAACSAAASARMRVPSAPAPAGRHERRSSGTGSPNARPNFQRNMSSTSRAWLSGSTASMTRSFTQPSGTTSEAAEIFVPASARRRWSAPESAGPAKGDPSGPGVKVSGGSGRDRTRNAGAAESVERRIPSAGATYASRSRARTNACGGRGDRQNAGENGFLRPSLNEGHLVDLTKRRLARQDLLDRRLAQEAHPLGLCRFLDLRGGTLVENEAPNAVREVEELGDRHPAVEARAVALDAATAFVESHPGHLLGRDRGLLEKLHSRRRHDPAVRADLSHEPLREYAVEGRDEVVKLDLHVEEAAEDVHDVVRVNGRENEVPREGGLHGDLRRLLVADLSDHDLVGVVPEDGAQPAREREAFLLVHGDLRHAAELVLDRVLDRDDLVFDGLNLREACVERRRLARARRPGDEHHAIRLADELSQPPHRLGIHAEDVEA